jgi:glycosyltransferase involved in cell wall biosynthesis
MGLPVTYDITRLLTRILNATPNGIDRVDLAYAEKFLADVQDASVLVHMGPLGHRAFAGSHVYKVISRINAHLGEISPRDDRTRIAEIAAWISGHAGKPVFSHAPARAKGFKNLYQKLSYGRVADFHLRTLGGLGQNPTKALPQGSRYLCVSQYPLSVKGAYNWLQARPDIKPIFFIHDLLPFQFPEYFKIDEYSRHETRMDNLVQYAAAALVSSGSVATALKAEMHRRGRKEFPIHFAPMPLASGFTTAVVAMTASAPYFVMCGTIEPRKNHLTMLHIWRDLAAQCGADTPKLVLVGARGWENENIIDLLERAPAMREHVLEVNGLSTPDLAKLVAGARALLMPSFGEGYGLPISEALALGVPVIASDIPVFHEVAGQNFTAVEPTDAKGWRRAIEAACFASGTRRSLEPSSPPAQTDFAKLRTVLEEI